MEISTGRSGLNKGPMPAMKYVIAHADYDFESHKIQETRTSRGSRIFDTTPRSGPSPPQVESLD